MIKYYCKTCKIDVNQSECSICGNRTNVESKLYWCIDCNIPLYDEVCPICHKIGKHFTSDARPVFPEERLLLEILLDKPLAFIKDSVWNGAGNRYYVNGKKVPISISETIKRNPDKVRNIIEQYSVENTYNYFNEYIDKWVLANSKHYEYITTEAKQYISDFSAKFINNDINAAFVSFSE